MPTVSWSVSHRRVFHHNCHKQRLLLVLAVLTCGVAQSFSVIDVAISVSNWDIILFSKPLFSIKHKAIDMQMNLLTDNLDQLDQLHKIGVE